MMNTFSQWVKDARRIVFFMKLTEWRGTHYMFKQVFKNINTLSNCFLKLSGYYGCIHEE